jgi:hypothetical protein
MSKKVKIRIRDEHPGSYIRALRNNFLGGLKYFDADPGIFLVLDPGRKKYESGINIPDPQHCLRVNLFTIGENFVNTSLHLIKFLAKHLVHIRALGNVSLKQGYILFHFQLNILLG